MFQKHFKQFTGVLAVLVLLLTATTPVPSQTGGAQRPGGELFGDAAVAFYGGHSATFVGGAAATHVDTMFFIADRAYTVTGIKAVWTTAEVTGAMDIQVERLQATEACTGGAGANLLSAVINATTTAATVNSGALTATVAARTMAVGDRLCLNLSATPTEITNMVVTVYFDATTAAGKSPTL